MEEGSSEAISDKKRMEELLDQLGTRYDQSQAQLDNPAIISSALASKPLQTAGTWLSDLKKAEQDQGLASHNNGPITQDPMISNPFQALDEEMLSLNDKVSSPGIPSGQITLPPPISPQIPGVWASNHVSLSGIQGTSTTSSKAKTKTTGKLDGQAQASAPTVAMAGINTPQDVQVPPTVTRIPPDPPRKVSRPGRGRYIIQIIICLVLLGGAGIFWLQQQTPGSNANLQQDTANVAPTSTPGMLATSHETSGSRSTKTPTTQKATPSMTVTQTAIATVAANPTSVKATPTPIAPMNSYTFSFENGTNGWGQNGNISQLASSANVAMDGRQSLLVAFNSANDQDFPFVFNDTLPTSLPAGKTVTAYIYAAQGTDVQATLFVMDQNWKWYGGSFVTLPGGTWYRLSYTIPATMPGSARTLGVQLYGVQATVYIDAVTWN